MFLSYVFNGQANQHRRREKKVNGSGRDLVGMKARGLKTTTAAARGINALDCSGDVPAGSTCHGNAPGNVPFGQRGQKKSAAAFPRHTFARNLSDVN